MEGHGYFGRHDAGHSSPLNTGEQPGLMLQFQAFVAA
jgi:hypothetical protein